MHHLRTATLYACCTLVLFLAGCEQTPQNQMLGTWVWTKYDTVWTITFKADGTWEGRFIREGRDSTSTGTWIATDTRQDGTFVMELWWDAGGMERSPTTLVDGELRFGSKVFKRPEK